MRQESSNDSIRAGETPSGGVSLLSLALEDLASPSAGTDISIHAQALRSLSVAVSITDMQDRVLFVNPAFCELYGFDEAELMGNSIAMVRSTRNQIEVVREILPATLRGGWEGELWNRRRDGTEFEIFLTTSAVIDADGRTVALVGVATDVTQRKSAQEALKKSEEMFSTAFSSSPTIGAILSLQDYRYINVNKAFEERTGYSRAEAIGRTPVELGLRRDPAGMDRTLRTLRLDGHLHSVEMEFFTKSGGILVGLLSAVVVEFGGQMCVLASTEDITERKRMEAALSESLEHFRAVSTAARDAIVIVDNEGKVSYWSDAAERILGHEREAAIGRNVHEILAPAGVREGAQKALAFWRSTGHGAAMGQSVELVAQRADGSTIPVELSLSSVRIHDRLNAVGIVRDISTRKLAEETLRKANEELSASLEQLKRRGFQSAILDEMREFLLASASIKEIGPVIARSLGKLFPGACGALFILSPSKTDLETAVSWGGYPKGLDDNFFSPDACWGLRRGAAYHVDDLKDGPFCPHLEHAPRTMYACLPLTAKTDVLGLLHFRKKAGAPAEAGIQMLSDLREVSGTLCEMLSLSISNIRLRETLRNQSIRDPLTGLFNRRFLEESLMREVHRAARNDGHVGVLMIDVDHFKKFNDVHGHHAGDLVLQELAKVFGERTRGSDLVCRYGGEEFAIVLPDMALQDAGAFSNELLGRVREVRIPFGGRNLGPVTVSVGVSAFPETADRPDDLLRLADLALYEAKRKGRDRVETAG